MACSPPSKWVWSKFDCRVFFFFCFTFADIYSPQNSQITWLYKVCVCVCNVRFTELISVKEHKHPTMVFTSVDLCCSQVDKQEWRWKLKRNLLDLLLSVNSSTSEQDPMWRLVFISTRSLLCSTIVMSQLQTDTLPHRHPYFFLSFQTKLNSQTSPDQDLYYMWQRCSYWL